ncbi:MAG: hypothetical protein ACI4GA_07340 [Acutalibacteraceae bacterium]|nr:DivIVA domain-containing protein [Oscillospiraceae bacterium]
MTQFKFKTEANGYSIEEVDKYIEMLQSEYKNAVQWSNEIEKQLENNSSVADAYKEIETLKKENDKLLGDCKLLAAKLKAINEQQEKPVEKKEAKPEFYDSDTANVVNGIISAANKKAQDIVSEAYKTQDMIFANRITSARQELNELEEKKKKAEAEIDALTKLKNEILGKLNSVRENLEA